MKRSLIAGGLGAAAGIPALLLGAAPPGPLGGEAGHRVRGDLIDCNHPSLCPVVGATGRRGFRRIARTLVDPRRLVDGSSAWLDGWRSAGEPAGPLGL